MKQRFDVPYMHCGCPLPGDTIGQKLAKLTHRLSISRPSNLTGNSLLPPAHPDAFSATHPSEHNCVEVEGRSTEARRQARLQKLKQRRERDAKRVDQGKMDRAAYERGEAHNAAFLYPVPFFYPPVVACGAVGVGGAFASCGLGASCAVVRWPSSFTKISY